MTITTEGSVHSIFQTSEQRPIEFEAVNNKSSPFIRSGFFGSREWGGGGWGQCLPARLTFGEGQRLQLLQEERIGQARWTVHSFCSHWAKRFQLRSRSGHAKQQESREQNAGLTHIPNLCERQQLPFSRRRTEWSVTNNIQALRQELERKCHFPFHIFTACDLA